MLNVGDPAPDFTVQDHTGGTVSLSAQRGKNVILWFYPKADTPGWTKEGRGFRDLYADFQSKGVVILGVSFDNVTDNRAFAEKFEFPFPLLCDETRSIGMAYGACDTPDAEYARRITYVIGADGTISQTHPKVSPAEHPQELLASL
jgi:peroxiredoxin Q/BCP